MSSIKILLMFLLSLLTSLVVAHDTPTFRPESHAPAGVMSDHIHKKGEWMIGYRFSSEKYEQYYSSSKKISLASVIDSGYSMTSSEMTMDMHMLDIMYAVNDDLTLMLMPMYMTMDMDMNMGSPLGMGINTSLDMGMSHSHGTSGLGDTIISALYRIQNGGNNQTHISLGMSAPTGSVTKKNVQGKLTHYDMQLGSGTWDFLPSITYTGFSGQLSWGGQLQYKIALEGRNKSGYSLGDTFDVSAWAAWRVAPWISLSSRIHYSDKARIDGAYPNFMVMSPSDDTNNYGEEFTIFGIGANFAIQNGPFARIRVGIEWVELIDEHYNGIQLGRSDKLNLSISYSFK
mgnify:CR=1 FL=1